MDAEEYRRWARQCLVVARQFANPESRAGLLDAALLWRRLAKQAEKKKPPIQQQQQQIQPKKG